MTIRLPLLCLLALGAAFAATQLAPGWLLSLGTAALSRGLVALGIVVLMRAGVVSFGQGLFFALGGYAAALGQAHLGMQDILLVCLLGAAVAGLVAWAVSPLMARYTGVFFGMLSLALSMVLYGILVKAEWTGGSDGLNVARGSILGLGLEGMAARNAYFLLAALFATLLSAAAWLHFRAEGGIMALAVRQNALRVEYLGRSARAVVRRNYVIAAAIAGLGGALAALSVGHVDPDFAYWTTSGELMFIAVLAGYHSAIAVFVASFVLEIVRSFSGLYFPNAWQMSLGFFLLFCIAFLPNGLGSLWIRRRAREAAPPAPATPFAVEAAR